MKLTLKHAIAAIIVVLRFGTPVAAGPLEDADAAIKRRDYATAVRLIRPLAEQGDANAHYKLGVFYDRAEFRIDQKRSQTDRDLGPVTKLGSVGSGRPVTACG